ncbi:MAG: trimethylamine methyltransferase family protein [Anaerolineae bacterium]|jgi:trimethylamine--corrinoid protein Co-methyltransferase
MTEEQAYSETPDIVPVSSPFRLEVLSQSELEIVRDGSRELLADVGVHVPSQRALEIFADHGAAVDWEKEVVRIAPDLVDEAMSRAPRSFVLGGRDERFDLTLDGSCSYLCTDGTGVHAIDLETREQRPSSKEDVAMMARVCDALPLLSFYWPPVSAQDYGRTALLHQCHAGLTNTLKHVRGGMTVPERLARYVVEMATVVAGGSEEVRRRSPICANICTIAPLAQDKDGIEAALVYAEAGIPTSFMAMPTMGSTAPATPLGALVMGDAEVVSGMVLLQLASPGTPVFHSIETSLMHPRTGGYIGGPSAPVGPMATQLAHAWGVPSLGAGSASTDSPRLDWQAGSDAGRGTALIPLAGAEICGYMALTGSSMILYPEKVILDHELCEGVHDYFRRFEFDPADMALDIIADVGPRGHFLLQKHTRDRFRSMKISQVLYQYDSTGGLRDPSEMALREFERINETHHPRPLPDEVLAELDRILAAAEGEVGEAR